MRLIELDTKKDFVALRLNKIEVQIIRDGLESICNEKKKVLEGNLNAEYTKKYVEEIESLRSKFDNLYNLTIGEVREVK